MRRILVISLAATLAGCGAKSTDQVDEAVTQNAEAPEAIGTNEAPTNVGDATAQGFVIENIPVSDTSLGDFPYIGLPEGYRWQREETRDFDRFSFWTGAGVREVEGKLFMGRTATADESKRPSLLELRRNLDAVIAQTGGVLVADSRIPKEIRDEHFSKLPRGSSFGRGNIHTNPVTTWLIRRADREIWIHAAPTGAGTAFSITLAETIPFTATARLLAASELKEAIDRDGTATVYVNFDTDSSEILPASQPQIDAIAALLRSETDLRLAVNGHTDNTGSATRNRTLSEQRAASVRQALIRAGTDADRLTAKGYGADNPVASNESEEGKAQNRRVELVRL